MANDTRPASTPRIARMLRELEGPPSGVEEHDVSPRMARSYHRRTMRRAGRRLLIGGIVIAGVALAVATDFLQFRVVAGQASAHQMAASVVPAAHTDLTR